LHLKKLHKISKDKNDNKTNAENDIITKIAANLNNKYRSNVQNEFQNIFNIAEITVNENQKVLNNYPLKYNDKNNFNHSLVNSNINIQINHSKNISTNKPTISNLIRTSRQGIMISLAKLSTEYKHITPKNDHTTKLPYMDLNSNGDNSSKEND